MKLYGNAGVGNPSNVGAVPGCGQFVSGGLVAKPAAGIAPASLHATTATHP